MHVTPSMSLSMRVHRLSRGGRTPSRIIAHGVEQVPLTAASAARWATLETFDVAWLWKLVDAFMTSSGPIIQPTRQPVIA